MKKISFSKIGCLACSISFLFAGQLMAAATTGTVTDVVAEIGGNEGPALEVKLSPSVQLGYNLEAANGTTFAINSENSTIDADSNNRNEYGIASDYSGYYQRLSATATGANLANPTADDSSAFNVDAYTKM